MNELCDENGRIRKGVNDELLKELQRDLGVRTTDANRDLIEANRQQAIEQAEKNLKKMWGQV